MCVQSMLNQTMKLSTLDLDTLIYLHDKRKWFNN